MISDWIPVIAAVLGAGGILGGIVLLLKVRPEAGQLVVSAAQDVVLIQKGVIDDLREQMGRLQSEVTEIERLRREVAEVEELRVAADELGEMRRKVAEFDDVREEVRVLRTERNALKRENVKLRERVQVLEEEVLALKVNGRNGLGEIERRTE